MILVLHEDANEWLAGKVRSSLARLGLESQIMQAAGRVIVCLTSDVRSMPSHLFSQIEGVSKVVRLDGQYPLAQEKRATTGSALQIRFANGTTIGGSTPGAKASETQGPVVIAGPCSVEGQGHILSLAEKVAEAGARLLRGGAFKPRTSPYDFRGLGRDALEYLVEARQKSGLPIVSEVMSAEQVALAEPYVDMFQIGARNMYNYELLREVGRTRRPVLLKRGISATIDEFLHAAEYILLEGNLQVVLCERGIRTFETHTRNTLDLASVAALKNLCQLPVIVDPSHGTGRRELIRPMSRAAIACGADGLMIEVHADPQRAMSDGAQAITPDQLQEIVADIKEIHNALSARSHPPACKSEAPEAGNEMRQALLTQ